ncbi:hypothetical protein DFQ27_001794 [Actinomortierella ambigua]|uniref:Uncharacterized protein n=1 Tax=Actinomortierella ambigua TaxID=1343610 RepID=A0A9P6U740_9FUNG|nr:hypothetical protein DFQ27_001794 [Actinomortierella ambigua]
MDAVSVLASFPHLQELDLLASLCLAPALKATRTLTNDSTQTQAQRLKLAFSGVIGATGLAPLLLRCPNLTHLDFGGVRALDIPTLQVLVSRNLLYWLTSLTIGRYAYDGTAQLILQALGRTQRLRRLCLGNPTEPTLEVLSKHHGQHLEQLTLVDFNCAAVSPMVVLATCTALKTFVITSMQGMPLDVRKVVDQPWACTQLESLKMPLSLELRSNQALLAQEGRRRAAKVDNISDNDARMLSEWREAEMALMERLGTLTQLRELRLMARKKSRLTSGDSMSWRLTTGLDRLQDLDRLEVLDLGLRPYVQTMREFQWMKEHWTSLKRLVIYRFDNAQRRAWFRHEWPEVKVVELCRKRRSR